MKEVYEFLDDAWFILGDYFEFFYEKRLEDFKTFTPSTIDEYKSFRGNSKGIKDREKDFENRFYWKIKDYVNDETGINVYNYICQIENVMFIADNIGRKALINRVIKKINDIIVIGKYGISEMDAFSGEWKAEVYDVLGYSFNIHGVENKVADCLDGIEWVASCFYSFICEFKELCDDFGIDTNNIFDNFIDIPLSESIENKKGRIIRYSRDGYKDIFRSPWKGNIANFEKILETSGYTKGGKWIGESGRKSELAELFYYLQEKGIIMQGNESKQLGLLYSKFGLTVGRDNTKNGEYCTIRGLLKAKGKSDTKDIFERIFKQWVNNSFM